MATNHTKQQFYDMFVEQLQDAYSAENQIIQAMPKLLNAIKTKELKDELDTHFKETKKQKERLEGLFQKMKASPNGAFCEGMKGLLAECDKIVQQDMPPIVKDAALIGMLQKVQHYEIAAYGTLRSFAKHLELADVRHALQKILDEEAKADKHLTAVAEGGWFTSGVNAEAVR